MITFPHAIVLKKSAKKVVSVGIAVLLFFVLTKPNSRRHVQHSVFVPNRPAKSVWDYMADLNNIRTTNPSLKKFAITFDANRYPAEWHYGAILTEDISRVGTVDINAEYVVKPWGEDYVIECVYEWCKFLVFCVHANSTTTFKSGVGRETPGTSVSEVLQLRMPALLSWHLGSVVEDLHVARLRLVQNQLASSN